MGLLNKEDRSRAGGNMYDPQAGQEVTLIRHYFEETQGKDKAGKPITWQNLAVQMDWEGKPDDAKDKWYGAFGAEIDKKGNVTSPWIVSSPAERYIDSLVSAIKVAGIEIADGDNPSIFDGLKVTVVAQEVPGMKAKKWTSKDGKKSGESIPTELLIAKVIGKTGKTGSNGGNTNNAGNTVTIPEDKLADYAKVAGDANGSLPVFVQGCVKAKLDVSEGILKAAKDMFSLK